MFDPDKVKLVYIAGPYSSNPCHGTNAAFHAAEVLINDGEYVPLAPHSSLLWDITHPKDEMFWYAYTLVLLSRCDILLRLPGESKGADAEVEWAYKHNMPVFFGTAEQFVEEYLDIGKYEVRRVERGRGW